MKKLVLAFVLLAAIGLNAQPSGSITQKFVWNQAAPTLADANAYTYKYYADMSATGQNLTTVCTGTAAPFVCSATIPAFTPGTHVIQLTAGNVAGESPKSAEFSFTFVVVPGTPTNIRIGSDQ